MIPVAFISDALYVCLSALLNARVKSQNTGASFLDSFSGAILSQVNDKEQTECTGKVWICQEDLRRVCV